MTKTVELTGSEAKVEGLGGQNVAVKNLGAGTIYVSTSPNVTPDADGVSEIPSSSGEVIFDAQGTVYLLGSGKTQCTGMEYAVPNFKMPSSSAGGGGGTSDITKAYVDAQDSTNLGAAKAYTDMQVSAVKSDVFQNVDDIYALQTGLSDLGIAVSTNTEYIGILQTDMTSTEVRISANTQAILSNSNAISEIQADITKTDSNVDRAQAAIDNIASKSVVSTDGAFDLRYKDSKLQANIDDSWKDISTSGEEGVSQDYVDTHDTATLNSAKAHTNTEINAVNNTINGLSDTITAAQTTADNAQAAADANTAVIATRLIQIRTENLSAIVPFDLYLLLSINLGIKPT